MSELSLYYCPQTRCRTILWMLEEVRADYRLVPVNVRDANANEAFGVINPMRKVPALMTGGELVTETAAICLYLADAFPEAGLAPEISGPGRAEYLRWMFFGSAVMEPAAFDKASGRDSPAGAVGWGEWSRVLDTLHKGLDAHDYLVGDRFSAADVVVGATMGFLMNFNMMEKDPVFVAYRDRLIERAAFKTASALDAERAAAAG